jgi:hypothetical protein
MSTPIQLGTYHMIADSGYEPQRTNNFEVQITGLDGLTTVKSGVAIGNASQSITLAVASYSAPEINMGKIDVAYGNNKVKFAGVPEFPESSIVLNDYIGNNIESIIMGWFKLVYNPNTQKIGKAINYKKLGYLHEYTPDGSLDREWELHGVWPSSVKLGDFKQEGGEIRQITVTLQYDYAIPVD